MFKIFKTPEFKKAINFYKDGIKEGKWMHYNFNGTLMEHSGMYKNGEKIGD